MKRNIYADFSYLLILAASFGGVLVLGALVAPVIFHTDKILFEMLLDNYNAGKIMAEIFHRFSYWLYFVALFVVLYEAIMYRIEILNERRKESLRDSHPELWKLLEEAKFEKT